MTSSSDLVAARLPLEPGPPIDPFVLAGTCGIVFVSEGRVLVGLGCATTLALPHGLDVGAELADVGRRLAAIPCEDRVGPVGVGPAGRVARAGDNGQAAGKGVVAFGALPFDRSASASLIVPEVLFAREPTGEEWLTVVSPGRHRLPVGHADLRSWLLARSGLRSDEPVVIDPGSAARPHVMSISTEGSSESFEAMVDEALVAIHHGDLDKVVLARSMEVTAGDTIDIAGLLHRWNRLEPDCALFSMPGTEGQFVGASPELLVERSGTRVRSRPLAGTTFRSAGDVTEPGTPTVAGESLLPTELLASVKDGREHGLVVEAIAQQLEPLCAELDIPPRPELVRLHNIAHLGTTLVGVLARRAGRPAPSALELVGALHPTPAVGGVPVDSARSLIARLEPRPRGRYAGPVGYLDAAGDGKWVLGIRAVSIRDRTAGLAAGVGIVDGSDPRAELAETILKFNAVLDALAPGFRLAMPAAREDRAREEQPAVS
jgi:isochorismate synthase